MALPSNQHDAPYVRTRLLILSDTHANDFPEELDPSTISADVVIHCGDLTESSLLKEYKHSIQLLKSIKAPLKLVIAGNHDFSLDPTAFQEILSRSPLGLDDKTVRREFGAVGDARALLLKKPDEEEGESSGIVFLDEGTHSFQLTNGAEMTVFASPYTPSKHCGWGFQYVPRLLHSDSTYSDGHDWPIQENTDVVITHGPPHGILDRTSDRQRAGSQGLFAAVERERPRLHCFGHIHEGWGARMVTWREEQLPISNSGAFPSHLTHVDNDKSTTIESLAGLKASKFDSEADASRKKQKLVDYQKQRACVASHKGNFLGKQEQTLFVNAAIQGEREEGGLDRFQLPWVVDLELRKAQSSTSG